MQIALWSAQTLLVLVFASAGLAKFALPISQLVSRMGLCLDDEIHADGT
jgi:hypothetical protein